MNPPPPSSKATSKSRRFNTLAGGRQAYSQPSSDSIPEPIYPPAHDIKFADLASEGIIDSTLLYTITNDLQFETMTSVQAATVFPLLSDHADVLAQAKTGTGKTIAFLLPAIQNLLNRGPTKPGSMVSALIVSPTRELAMQIGEEAKSLLRNLPEYTVRTVLGGANKAAEEKRLERRCDILVGTPGRLFDHLEAESGILHQRVQQLDTLVLDEADRLLDMGFLSSLKKIIAHLPNKTDHKRQSMLFSATVPKHVQPVARLVLSPEYKYISAIPKGEVNIHQRVSQNLVVVPNFADLAAGVIGAIRQEHESGRKEAFKAIVFVPTARLVDFYAAILKSTPGLPQVSAIHSRLTQPRRTRVTDEFRQARTGILVATDVIARGMDFPWVTNVFQIGIAADKESYVHRLGRTARAGAMGRGTLVLTTHESFFHQRDLAEIEFEKVPADLSAHPEILNIAKELDAKAHGQAYVGWLGFYKQYLKPMGWAPERLVEEANHFAIQGLGASEIPSIRKSIISKMGLKGVPGLVSRPEPVQTSSYGARARQDD
ncbi:DEAD-domain-containing protein [Durotheca rogersii]|uniref:DEAD-domain-containing protein n=1 Tax=Durotheca rogersii TaxID=419775 RepID=UPI00222075B4|nr:DEAD-domain-containing protein [Durotheca rogersii]KAI5859857.1 DEAD-domain-containing protein [Durotheca rogersii]